MRSKYDHRLRVIAYLLDSFFPSRNRADHQLPLSLLQENLTELGDTRLEGRLEQIDHRITSGRRHERRSSRKVYAPTGAQRRSATSTLPPLDRRFTEKR